ncbi:hypothetical protein [Calothrix rhizosoleniae]|nr:hypothetical protein [Calothrix rhizosoleniae]
MVSFPSSIMYNAIAQTNFFQIDNFGRGIKASATLNFNIKGVEMLNPEI